MIIRRSPRQSVLAIVDTLRERELCEAADAQEQAAALAMAAWSVPLEQVEARPRRLYVTVDGVMVHRTQWNEAKCVCCYWEDEVARPGPPGGDVEEGRTPPRHSRYCVCFESVEQFKAFVWSLAMRCGLEQAVEVVLLGDGAAWIWDQVAPVLGERTVCITDWYHVTEHVWDCAKALFGEGSEAGQKWAERVKSLLWKGGRKKVKTMLEEERRVRRSGSRSAVEGLLTYLENQGDRIAYDRFRAKRMDVGSGRVEAACKQVGVRMKRAGMCWSNGGAQATLSLRSVWLNGEWDAFWENRPLAA